MKNSTILCLIGLFLLFAGWGVLFFYPGADKIIAVIYFNGFALLYFGLSIVCKTIEDKE